MAGITGANLYVKFGSTVLDADYRTFGASEEIGIVDETAGADANRTYLGAVKDGTATITIIMQAGVTTEWDALVPGTTGTLEWAEEGTAGGKPKHSVTAIVTGREKSTEYADLVMADISFQFSGAVTDTVY